MARRYKKNESKILLKQLAIAFLICTIIIFIMSVTDNYSSENNKVLRAETAAVQINGCTDVNTATAYTNP